MVDIVVQVVDERGALPTSQCDVTYNSRNRPATISENGWRMELSYGSGLQREKSVLKNGNTPVCTTYFISKDSEHEIKPSSTRYIDYIYAEGRIVALHVHNTTANADSLYYVQTDLLGSWVRIVNGNRQVVQRSHFDPWGNRMSATNSINFGIASYDFTNNSWGYLFKRGNKWYENIGYGFGSMANLSDMVSLIYGGGENLNVNAANKKEGDHDWYSHISITRMDESTLLSIGPNEEYSRYIDVIFGSIDADKGYPSYISDQRIWSVKLTNISYNAIQSYSARVTGWNLMLNSCVGHATRALWCAGVPVIYLFHPYMLNVQLIIRQLGIYSSPYLYQF